MEKVTVYFQVLVPNASILILERLSLFFFFVLILLLNLNAEFQRIARRDKKAFLSEKCKEIEGKKKQRNGEDQRSHQEGLIPQKHVQFIIGDWNAKVGTQEIPAVTGKFGLAVQNEAGQNLTVLPRECTGHGKHPLPKTQEIALNRDITSWLI